MKSPISKRFFHKKRLPLYVAALSGAALTMPALAQSDDPENSDELVEEVIVIGIRASIQSAQDLKRDSDVIQDSIVAEDIGKLPDRSIAEALQRVPGVTVSRFDDATDPEHFAGEGAGVAIRGLTQVRSELNGRDIFSATDGRSLGFDDVPAELMAGVDVIKTPTADMVEGGLGGIVNLRTRMPFDQEGQLVSGTIKANYGDIIQDTNFEASILYSNNWESDIGRMGFIIDISESSTASRADNLYVRAYFPRTPQQPFENELVGDKYSETTFDENGNEIGPETFYVPRGADWRRNDFDRTRKGKYLGFQWEPNDHVDVYFTAFESRAKREWYENAFFLDNGGFPDYAPIPGNQIIEGEGDTAEVVGYESDDWVFDQNNVFVEGTITTPNGVPLGTSSRFSDNSSTTTDISMGVEWISGSLVVSADYQRVLSSAKKDDYTLGTVAFPARIRVENMNSADGPDIYDLDNHLETLTNYSFGQMMSIPADNKADSTALRLDLEYDMDSSLIDSVKSGVRYAERTVNNRGANNWTARVQPWNTCCWGDIPTISENNPLMQPFSFGDFQRGEASVPVDGWMFTRQALKDFRATTDAMVSQTPTQDWATWVATSPDWDALDLNNPSNVEIQEDTTIALYVMSDFSINEILSGNIGVRYVETELTSLGYLNYSTFEAPPENTTPFLFDSQYVFYKNDYSFVLPSLNLKFSPTEDIALRLSIAKQIWKPEFWRTGAAQKLEVEWKGEDQEGFVSEEERGQPDYVFDRNHVNLSLSVDDQNPLLEPIESMQYDVTAEWYFNEQGGMLYAGAFVKEVSELFRVQNETIEFDQWSDVSRDRVINIGTADVLGVEVGGTYYFDFLGESFDGLGVSANYTYIDSESRVPEESGAEPVDTDGSTITGLPLEGLAENTYNLTLIYETPILYARLAYNWHSEIFQNIGPNGWNGENYDIDWRLPVYSDDYGQLDLSAGYNINENLSINFEAYNLLQADTKGIMRQNAPGNHTAYVYTNDARYGLSLRMTF